MAVANAAQTLATEQEFVRPELENLTLSNSTLLKRIEKNTRVKPVSDRPTRIPTMPSRGGKPRVGNLNGGDMGIGSGPTTIPGQVTTVALIDAFSYTAQAEYATDSTEKAIEDFATLTKSIAPKHFADFMETLLQGDGTGQLDVIVGFQAQGGNIVGITVNNANLFLEDEDIDIWTAVGGTYVGSITVSNPDIYTNTIWLQNPVPTGTFAIGQGLFVSGSAAQQNSNMNGIRTFHVATNTGSWLTVPRASWPGKYNTAYIPVNGALTPQIVRALISNIELKKGEDEVDDLVMHSNVDVRDAWEQNALLVQRIDMTNLRGDRSMDMLKRKAPDSIGGYENLVNVRALPGYLDVLKLQNWGRVETKAVDFYDIDGQTLFPIYGNSGGLTSSMVFYMVWIGQIYAAQTIEEAFLNGVTTPKGLFGK